MRHLLIISQAPAKEVGHSESAERGPPAIPLQMAHVTAETTGNFSLG
jgi:hypothetical protein